MRIGRSAILVSFDAIQSLQAAYLSGHRQPLPLPLLIDFLANRFGGEITHGAAERGDGLLAGPGLADRVH